PAGRFTRFTTDAQGLAGQGLDVMNLRPTGGSPARPEVHQTGCLTADDNERRVGSFGPALDANHFRRRQMSNATKNGTPRKLLSEQIDRRDGVIDALDEGLRGAVADAVREAVGAAVNEAVQAVLVQVLTTPEMQKRMRQAAAPAGPPPPRDDKGSKDDKIDKGANAERP